MEGSRILNILRDTWGTAIIFSPDHAKTKEKDLFFNSRTKLIGSGFETLRASIDKTNEGLSLLMSSLFTTILEDTITELRCLDGCNNEWKYKTLEELNSLKVIKYDVKLPPSDELEGVNKDNINSIKYKTKKLAADRKYIIGVMLSTYHEMAMDHKFTQLRDSIKQKVENDQYNYYLEMDTARNKLTRKDLSRKVRQQRGHIRSTIYDTNMTIENLMAEIADSLVRSETGSRYIDKWQGARTEQHNRRINNKENIPTSSASYYRQRLDDEQRVHYEVELLGNICINEIMAKIQDWMKKYDDDLEEIDHKIRLKKYQLLNVREKRAEMENTLQERDTLMKNWIHFKEEREAARRYRMKMMNSAIAIQSWWRGLMVRLKLGPYAVKKEDKKTTGKEKKKK